MFERFEEDAVRAILMARDEACRLGHTAVGAEHLLLGLVGSDPKIAALVVGKAPPATGLADALVAAFGKSEPASSGDLPFGPDAQRAISQSWAIAEEFRHGTISPLHLLIAVLRADNPRCASLLAVAAVDPMDLHAAAKAALSPATRPAGRGGFQEDSLEVQTPYGPVTLTLLHRPDAGKDSARIISLSADTVSGSEAVLTFLAEFDRLLDASAGGLGVRFLKDLFTGLGSGLTTYLG